MVNITFNLDKTYKVGTDKKEIIKYKAQGKSIAKFLNHKETPIYLWVSSPEFEHFKTHTGIRILPAYWDFEKKEAKSSCPNHIEINLLLSRLKSGIQGEILKSQINEKELYEEDIKQIVKDQSLGIKPVVKTLDFLILIDEFLEDKQNVFKSLTHKKYKSVRNVLERFENEEKFSLHLSKINFDFEASFKNHLIKRSVTANTISKYIECVKSIMRWARKKSYHKDNRFEEFKAPRYKTEKTALNLKELKILLNLEIDYKKEKGLALVRDKFCVQLLSGQRFSDVQAMRWNSIIIKDGIVIWKLFQEKSNKQHAITIPLHPWLIKILERYRKENWDGEIFPSVSNVDMNRQLKVLCERAGFNNDFSTVRFSGSKRLSIEGKKWSFVTTHTARRSFVTIAMQLGMNPQAIMRITGHTKYDVMQGYMKMDDSFQIDHFQNTWGKVDLRSDAVKEEDKRAKEESSYEDQNNGAVV